MQDLFIEATLRSPEVSFRFSENILRLKGRSQPEDSLEFYAPVKKWYEDFLAVSNGPVKLEFNLDYFNTASAKVIYELLMLLKKSSQNGLQYHVSWHCLDYDEDMRDAVAQFADLTGIEIDLMVH